MRAEKSNFSSYSSIIRNVNIQKSANITDIIKKNKQEEKKEKILKFYIFLGFLCITVFFGTIIYLHCVLIKKKYRWNITGNTFEEPSTW